MIYDCNDPVSGGQHFFTMFQLKHASVHSFIRAVNRIELDSRTLFTIESMDMNKYPSDKQQNQSLTARSFEPGIFSFVLENCHYFILERKGLGVV